jgi:uncharacterized protein YcgL (UPF0745 family)
MKKIMCAVYGSKRHEDMYVYLPKGASLESLPAALLKGFGQPRKAMEILLIPGKSLAQISVDLVLQDIARQGFYLQMPPAEKENWLAEYRLAQQQAQAGATASSSAQPQGEE